MTYKTQLDKINEMGINPYEIVTAAEVNFLLVKAYGLIDEADNDTFEKACELVYDTFQSCDGTGIDVLVQALAEMLKRGDDLDAISWRDLCHEANAIQF